MEGTPTGLHMSMMNEGENEIEEMEEEEDDGDDVEPMLPLSVEMEGKNRMLTVAILSFTALAVRQICGQIKDVDAVSGLSMNACLIDASCVLLI